MKAKVGDKEFQIEVTEESVIKDGKSIAWDCVKVKDGIFHVLMNGKSYNAEVLKAEPKEKLFVIRVNGNKYSISLKDKYDELLHTLGMDNLADAGMKELKVEGEMITLDSYLKGGIGQLIIQ